MSNGCQSPSLPLHMREGPGYGRSHPRSTVHVRPKRSRTDDQRASETVPKAKLEAGNLAEATIITGAGSSSVFDGGLRASPRRA